MRSTSRSIISKALAEGAAFLNQLEAFVAGSFLAVPLVFPPRSARVLAAIRDYLGSSANLGSGGVRRQQCPIEQLIPCEFDPLNSCNGVIRSSASPGFS